MGDKEAEIDKNSLELHIRRKDSRTRNLIEEIKDLEHRYAGVVRVVTLDLTSQPLSITPTHEASIDRKRTAVRLQKGNLYLFKEEVPNRSFQTFVDVVRSQCHDCEREDAFQCEALDCTNCTLDCPCIKCDKVRPQGLIISRQFPKKISQKFPIQTTPMIWLTQMRKPDIQCLNPNEISRLNATITSFVENSRNGLILFEGLEYLITQNSFDIVLKFIQHLHDLISPSKSAMIMTIDPLALDANQVHVIQRNMTEL
jgi:hypothetical protein